MTNDDHVQPDDSSANSRPHQIPQTPADVDADLRAELRALAVSLAREAGRLVRDARPDGLGVAATKSSEVDVVTVMDQRSETLLRERIRAARPQDAILGEEGDDEPGTSGLTWVVDPIDGTVNYLYGHPLYAVSVAVCTGDVTRDGAWESVAGAVYAPAVDELFAASYDQGATLTTGDGTERPLHIRAKDDLATALVGTGFGYEAHKRAAQADTLTRVLPAVRDIRRGGSAALDLCFVAAGRLDAYYESGINSWDRAAGQLVASEAGAEIAGASGRLAGKELVVCAPAPLRAHLQDCLTD